MSRSQLKVWRTMMMKRRMGLVLAVMSNVTGLNRLTLLKTTSARLCQPPVVQKIPSLPSIDRYKFSKSTFDFHITCKLLILLVSQVGPISPYRRLETWSIKLLHLDDNSEFTIRPMNPDENVTLSGYERCSR